MNPFIVNYYNLFSKDDDVFRNAIKIKWNWMFRRLFFPVTFNYTLEDGKKMYNDLYALMDQTILFKKADFSLELFTSKEQKEKFDREFNDYFRFAYCYEKIPSNLIDTFFVELDFRNIETKVYQQLVGNFFPCLEKKEDLDLWYEEKNDVDLLKFPMYGEYRKWVFILSKDLLANDRYYLPIMKKIYYSSSLEDDKIEAIKEIAKSIGIESEEI